MEEVDEIVIHTLRQVGCDIEDDVYSLRDFSTDLVISGVVRCLKLVNSTLEVSHNVPPSMSARYRLGATLAAECTSLGYKGEIGYQTFLYANESDLRKIFLFLIEKLPKESEKVSDQPLGKAELLLKECGEYFKVCLNTPWLPYYCLSKSCYDTQILWPNSLTDTVCYKSLPVFVPYVDKTWNNKMRNICRQHHKKYFQPLRTQVQSQTTLFCSVLQENGKAYTNEKENEWNEEQLTNPDLKHNKKEQMRQRVLDLLVNCIKQNVSTSFLSTPSKTDAKLKGSRFAHALDLQFATSAKETAILDTDFISEKPVNTLEDKKKKMEEEISAIQLQVDEVLSKFEETDLQNKKLESAIQQIASLMNNENKKVDGIKEEYKVKKCTMSLLPDADNNIKKLEGLIESSNQRLISLAAQWEQHRMPLFDKYNALKELSSQKLTETQKKLEEIKQMQEKIRNLGDDARNKDEMYKQLIVSYEKLTKDLNRSAYTRRIMEIVGNIKKQKEEIDKILLDTRSVQKEINRLSGKLERTFTVTDELIFKDAKKDESVRRAYKLLAALHENCSQLIQITEETGFIMREIRELEDHIEQENQKKVAASLERISSDFKQMQQENSMLITQLK